jgi:Ca2+-binding RTX toxin-like protein
MAIVTLFQPYDMSVASNDWTPPAPAENVTQLVFTNGNLRLELDSKGASPISLLSYQNGQLTGSIGEIHLSNDAGEILQINSGSGVPGEASPGPLSGTLKEWLALTGMFDDRDFFTGSAGNDVLLAYGGNDIIRSGAGNDRIDAGAGDDTIYDGAGNDTIDGGSGFDKVVWTGALADYKVARSGDVYTVTNLKDGSVDSVTNVERLDFDDKLIAADVTPDSPGGQIFRLYRAAFDRAPDASGLLYWTYEIGHDVKLDAMADAFIKSSEFQAHYGTGLSNHDLVAKFYENVLHRSADQAGLDFWAGALDSHAATSAQVLAAISESRENIDGTAALIGNGLVLDQPLVTI